MSADHSPTDVEPPPDADGMYVREVTQRLRCHKSHVYKLIEDGYLDVFPARRGAMIVTTESYRRYLASARRTTTAEAAAS